MDDKNLNSGKEKVSIKDEMLIPAIIQDYKTNEVLMLAYMSRESLRKSIETGLHGSGAGAEKSFGTRVRLPAIASQLKK